MFDEAASEFKATVAGYGKKKAPAAPKKILTKEEFLRDQALKAKYGAGGK